MAIFKNYYQVLGVEDFAEPEAIKGAFRRLARQYHPDLNAGLAQAEEKFKEINEAYEILGDAHKRERHDLALKAMQGARSGHPGHKKQGQAKAAQPGTPASGMGGGATGNASNKSAPSAGSTASPSASPSVEPKAEKPHVTPINDLFDTFLKKGFPDAAREKGKSSGGKSAGESEEGIFRKKKEPPPSGGEKAKRGEDVMVRTAITPQEATDGVVKTVNVQHNEVCKRCSGTGKVNGAVCGACQGEKILVRLKKIDVRIPAGVKSGSRVRVAREGGRGTGNAENGDLFLQIEIAYDASLRIEGLDVHGNVALSVTDAVLGGEVDVPTLNGPVKMTIPPGCQTGAVFRLKERGVQSGLSKGDHFVTVVLVTPDNLTPREKELYQELARLRPEKPTPKPSK